MAVKDTEAGHIGKYQLIRELGRGAMGVVWLARDPAVQRLTAVKTILHEIDLESIDDTASLALEIERFRREARAIARMRHQNIIGVYDFGEDDGQLFLAMEYVEGQTLKDLLEPDGYQPGYTPFTVADVGDVVLQLLAALDCAHGHGVIHRDIKPSNLMLSKDGVIKLMDFGIARAEGAQTLTVAGAVVGTPNYMAPEQCMGLRVDGRADLYSTGLLAYQLLTGEKPFHHKDIGVIMERVMNEIAPPPSRRNPQVPPALDLIVGRALAKHAGDRFANAAEFRAAVEQAFAAMPAALRLKRSRLFQAGLDTLTGPLPPMVDQVRKAEHDSRARGEDAPLVRAHLLCLNPEQLEGAPGSFEITIDSGREHIVGRDDSATLVVLSRRVSRRHARLFHQHGQWMVEDLASANGTFLHDRRIATSALSEGDVLRFGTIAFRFNQEGGARAVAELRDGTTATVPVDTRPWWRRLLSLFGR